MSRFFDWSSSDDPATIVRLAHPTDWDALERRYSPNANSLPLKRVLEIAQLNGVVSVVIEHRYIDADYRSEHATFYSTTFRRYPSVCHRLHFFTENIEDDLANLHSLHDAYQWYSVMRPLDHAPVGRTLISPPPELSDPGVAMVCTIKEDVHLFGVDLCATGFPFVSQDAQYSRCAHASQWMVLRHSSRRYGLPVRLPADIHEAASGGVVIGRQTPSEGLSMYQMLESLDVLGLSPGQLKLPTNRAESLAAGLLSLLGIVCRHVNSHMPPIILSNHHAWVVVGYRVESGTGPTHDRIVLYRHDDSMGPYIRVPDPWNEPLVEHTWAFALLPLQKKCYLSAERAEIIGSYWLFPQVKSAFPNISHGDVTWRTYAIPAAEFKAQVVSRVVPPSVSMMYRLLHMSRLIWVVEAIDRATATAGHPAVLGEAVIDSTANHVSKDDDPLPILSIHAGGYAAATSPDHDNVTSISEPAAFSPYASGCPAVVTLS